MQTAKGVRVQNVFENKLPQQNESAASVKTVEIAAFTRAMEFFESDSAIEYQRDTFFSLRHLHSFMFATILEEVILSLRILGECNNSSRVMKLTDDIPKRLQAKYSIQPPAVATPELDLIEPKRLGCEHYKMHKLENDRNDVLSVMLSTYRNLTLSRNFRILWNRCQETLGREYYVESVKNTESKNKMLARNLRRQLRHQKIQQRNAVYEANAIDDQLRKQIQDAEQMAAVEERYTVRWQNARKEQCMEGSYLKQSAYQNTIEHYKICTQQELKVHTEVDLLGNILIHETLEKVKDIMLKYEVDMEQMEFKIQIMMSNVNNITESNQVLCDELKRKEKEMKAWVEFKEIWAKKRKVVDDMNRSATTVQAWWRGILVRMQLGPYRQDKKGVVKKK